MRAGRTSVRDSERATLAWLEVRDGVGRPPAAEELWWTDELEAERVLLKETVGLNAGIAGYGFGAIEITS